MNNDEVKKLFDKCLATKFKALNTRIEDLKFVITRLYDAIRSDVDEIKKSNTEVSQKLDDYTENHQKHHDKILKWQNRVIIFIIIIGVLATIANPTILPFLLKATFGIIL